MFLKQHKVTPSTTPLVKRSHEPEWFTRQFLSTSEQKAKSKEVWATLLTPKLFSTRLGTSKENVKKMCYQPNLVSHQFGVSQTMPKPFFNRKSELCLCIVDYSENEYLQRLAKHVNGRVILIPFSFQQPSIEPKNSTLGGEPTKQKNFLKSKHYLNI